MIDNLEMHKHDIFLFTSKRSKYFLDLLVVLKSVSLVPNLAYWQNKNVTVHNDLRGLLAVLQTYEFIIFWKTWGSYKDIFQFAAFNAKYTILNIR